MMEKKIVVINYLGNVGKSTISQHLLAPRMNAPLIPMESINSDSYSSPDSDERVYAANMAKCCSAMPLADGGADRGRHC